MQRFKFRFSAVTKVRRLEMERQAKVVALIQQKIAAVHAEIEGFKELARKEILRIQDLTQKRNFADQLSMVSLHYREGLRLKGMEKRRELEKLELKLAEEKEVLIEKTKRKKAIDKLEEKEREAYENEARKTETKDMDEIAGILRDHYSE